MNEHKTGQVVKSAADVYEEFFVPALFGEWPPHLLKAANVQTGDVVLDVACGTGVLAREAAQRVGSTGAVTGVDINGGMLAVAQRKAPHIRWHTAPAEHLPFEDDYFDCVVSQFGLMFFADQVKAVAEMRRVLRDGGRLAVAVWDSLANTPGYTAVTKMLNDLFGAEVAQSIEAPFTLGNTARLKSIFERAGLNDVMIETIVGAARFESIESWLYTDIRGWTLADVIDDEAYEKLQAVAPQKLAPFVLADGSVAFDSPAHIVSVTVPY